VPPFSLAPGDGRGAAPILLAQPAPGATSSAPSAQIVPQVKVTRACARRVQGVVVMDYTTDFPELPAGEHESGAPVASAWAPKLRSSNVSVVFHLPGDERSARASTFGEGKATREQELCGGIAESMSEFGVVSVAGSTKFFEG